MTQGIEGEHIFAEQLEIARGNTLALAAYVAVATGLYVIIDIFFYENDGLYLLTSFVVWGLGFALLVFLMQNSAPPGEKHAGGIGGYFGLSLISSFAIGIAALFFLLPGIYLLMRWMPSYARLYHRGQGVTEALGWSWENTARMQKGLLLAVIGPLVVTAATLALIAWQTFNYEEAGEIAYNASIVGMNLGTSISAAWIQVLGVAAYRLIQRQQSEPVEVFE